MPGSASVGWGTSGDSFDFNAHNLGGGQVNQGNTVNAVQNAGSAGAGGVTFQEFAKHLRESIGEVPPEARDFLQETAIGPLEEISDDAKYGDEYCWCGSVRWRSRDEIEIGPYDRKIEPAVWDAIVVACSEAGVKRVLARTYPSGSDGPVRERWFDIEKKMARVRRKARRLKAGDEVR